MPTLILSNPLGADRAAQAGLEAREYVAGELVEVDAGTAGRLLRAGYAAAAGTVLSSRGAVLAEPRAVSAGGAVLLVLSNPLGSDDAQRIGLPVRGYAVGEIISVDEFVAATLIRTGYAVPADDSITTVLLIGDGPPTALTGVDGQWYLDDLAEVLYGPKTGGVWPTGVIRPGRAIATITVNGSGHLVVTYSTGETVDLGGVMGPTGPSGTITSATATGLAAGAAPTVTLGGTASARTVAFGIPAGAQGVQGPAGTITSATATGLAAGAAPTVTLGGTSSARTMAFGIPAGVQGVQGIQGVQGPGYTSRGAWAAGTAYAVRDVVTSNGSTFEVTVAHTAAEPAPDAVTPGANFRLWASKGDQGPVGAGAPDATATASGSIRIAGDLGGTATAPQVVSGANHGHTAAQLSDASTVGRSVLTATDAASARTVIGAGTSSLVLGTTSTTAAAGNDSRLSDARTPTAHTHTASQISDATTVGRSVLTATDAPTARTAIGAGTSSLVLGTAAGTAAAGNDSRLSDARTPTAHTHTASQISDATTVGQSVLTAADAPTARAAIGAGTSSLAIGTTSTTAAAGNDSRLSNARTPTAHASTHATGGTDPVTPAAIGAAATSHTHTSAQITDATSTPTPNTLMKTDAAGRSQVADPAVAADIATKNYVDTLTGDNALASVRSVTASTTLTLADSGEQVLVTSSSATTVTVPLNSSVAFGVGARVDIVQGGLGLVTIVPVSGVTIVQPAGSRVTGGPYSRVTLTKMATDTWYLRGDLAPTYGKIWRTAAFGPALSTTDLVVGFNASRLSGGMTAGTNTLIVPMDGIYSVLGRCYVTGGSSVGTVAFKVKRTRSGVADGQLMALPVNKADLNDFMPLIGDNNVPLKAGDALYMTIVQTGNAIVGGTYWGGDELNGVFLEAAWVGPLNGAIPL